MTPLFKKLNFKNHPEIVVWKAPSSLNEELTEMSKVTRVSHSLKVSGDIDFAMIFITNETEVRDSILALVERLKNDAILWFCYPKGTSKRYGSEINRDKGWQALGDYNFEPVRQVAIDEDWSALRFRKTNFIKSMVRRNKMALSPDGKARTQN